MGAYLDVEASFNSKGARRYCPLPPCERVEVHSTTTHSPKKKSGNLEIKTPIHLKSALLKNKDPKKVPLL